MVLITSPEEGCEAVETSKVDETLAPFLEQIQQALHGILKLLIYTFIACIHPSLSTALLLFVASAHYFSIYSQKLTSFCRKQDGWVMVLLADNNASTRLMEKFIGCGGYCKRSYLHLLEKNNNDSTEDSHRPPLAVQSDLLACVERPTIIRSAIRLRSSL